FGVEAFAGVVRPFAEWNLGVPFNRQRYTCLNHTPFSSDGCLGKDYALSAFPSTLTLGARTTPWLPGLTGTLAIDIGTSGTSNFIEELAPTLPWDLWLRLASAVDADAPPPARGVRGAAARLRPRKGQARGRRERDCALPRQRAHRDGRRRRRPLRFRRVTRRHVHVR